MRSDKDALRAERLFSILGEIDPEMSVGEEQEPKNISLKTGWAAVLGIAAVLALVVGVFGLHSRHGLTTTPIPTTPTVDYSTPNVTEPPPAVEPDVSDTAVSDHPEEPDADIMPELFSNNGEGTGGDENAMFFSLVKWKFDGIDMCLSDLRERERGEMWERKWADSMKDNGEAVRADETVNIYAFIKAFGITKEEAEAAYEYCLDSGDDQLISRAELDILYSGDEEAIARTVASDYAIVVGDKIYSPYWLYLHSVEDYAAAGIDPMEIKRRESLYDEFNFSIEVKNAFLAKLRKYVPDIRFERLERRIAYSNIFVDVNGGEGVYDISWLSSHTIQDYRAAGITIDDLKMVLEKMSYYGMSDEYDWINLCYGMSDEYDWINSCYERMVDDMMGGNIPEDSMAEDVPDAVDEIWEDYMDDPSDLADEIVEG